LEYVKKLFIFVTKVLKGPYIGKNMQAPRMLTVKCTIQTPIATGSPVAKAAIITSKTVPILAPKIYGKTCLCEVIIPVATRGISKETITDVLGTIVVKINPARKERYGFPKVDFIRPFETSVENIADIYFSLFLKEKINKAQPPRNPTQAGKNVSKKSTQGDMILKIDGIAEIPGIILKNDELFIARCVSIPNKYSIGKNKSKVKRL
jgi:hypothetical protein